MSSSDSTWASGVPQSATSKFSTRARLPMLRRHPPGSERTTHGGRIRPHRVVCRRLRRLDARRHGRPRTPATESERHRRHCHRSKRSVTRDRRWARGRRDDGRRSRRARAHAGGRRAVDRGRAAKDLGRQQLRVRHDPRRRGPRHLRALAEERSRAAAS